MMAIFKKMGRKYRGFIIGLLMGGIIAFSTTSIAETMKQYLLVEVTYPLHVNGIEYDNKELPTLNYEGHTYIPMKNIGDLLGASVIWNEADYRVDIQYGGVSEQNSSPAFRNVSASGNGGTYTIAGEARVFEGQFNYAVSDGHNYLLESSILLEKGAPDWTPFSFEIKVPADQLPSNGTLTIEVFEISAKDGSPTNYVILPLESFPAE